MKLLSEPTEASMSPHGSIAIPVAGPAWSEKEATSFPLSKTLTDPLVVATMILAPDQMVSVMGSSALRDRSTLAASTEKMPTLPCRPLMAAYSPSKPIEEAWGTGMESDASLSNEEISSGVAHPLGTGRFFRDLESLHHVSVSTLRTHHQRTPNILLVCSVHLLGELLGQPLVVDGHLVAIGGRAACRDGHLGERVSGLVPLPRQSGDYSDGGIVLVQGRSQLLPRARQLLLQIVRLEGQRVPLVLERRQEGGYGGQSRRSRSDYPAGLEREQVFDIQLVVGAGFFSVFIDVLFDEALLVHSAGLPGHDGLLGSFARDCA